jgi:hypothetical protein
MAFDEENLRSIITNPDLKFIRDEVAIALGDEDRFFSISKGD